MHKSFIKKYSAETTISASPEAIWKVLIDFPNYRLWNHFVPEVEVDWRIGGKVKMTVHMTEGKKPILQTEYLSLIDPEKEFAYGVNWGIFLKAERIQRITPLPDGKTHYYTEDVMKGWMSPIVDMMYGKSINQGFEKVAQGLKKHCEGL